ncbi:DNA replication licensing factor MCM7, partial [Zancudomyces culisetae]
SHDLSLARHVTRVHMTGAVPAATTSTQDNATDSSIISPAALASYIAHARSFTPTLSSEVSDYIVESYVSKRIEYKLQLERSASTSTHGHSVKSTDTILSNSVVGAITPRSLLGIIRLSQAHARLRLASHVTKDDVDVATKLMYFAQETINHLSASSRRSAASKSDYISTIFMHLSDMLKTKRNLHPTINNALVYNLAFQSITNTLGFTDVQFAKCLDYYDNLGLIHINPSKTRILFISS